MHSFILKGQIIHAPSPDQASYHEDSYLVVEDGAVVGIFNDLPCAYDHLPVTDYGDQLILPGLNDLHVHAAQFAFRGLGMDMQLLDWLDHHAFPEEARFSSPAYAHKIYGHFADALLYSPTTRASVFASIHRPATNILMGALAERGLAGFVGKLNMDRNSAPTLTEDTASSLELTEAWIKDTSDRFGLIRPIITPRFIPSCTPELLEGLGHLSAQYEVPVQSHVSENKSEIAWVRELEPEAKSYSDAYDRYQMFGRPQPAVMAHMVHPTENEWELMKSRNVTIAHCPASNMNVMSGLAPVRRMLEEGVKVGLGTDVAGGHSLSMFQAMVDAIHVSKLRTFLTEEGVIGLDETGVLDTKERPLTVVEAFFMATRGGGQFFGNVGDFSKGRDFDAIVVDDSALLETGPYSLADRLERAVYSWAEVWISAKYVAGKQVLGGDR